MSSCYSMRRDWLGGLTTDESVESVRNKNTKTWTSNTFTVLLRLLMFHHKWEEGRAARWRRQLYACRHTRPIVSSPGELGVSIDKHDNALRAHLWYMHQNDWRDTWSLTLDCQAAGRTPPIFNWRRRRRKNRSARRRRRRRRRRRSKPTGAPPPKESRRRMGSTSNLIAGWS